MRAYVDPMGRQGIMACDAGTVPAQLHVVHDNGWRSVVIERFQQCGLAYMDAAEITMDLRAERGADVDGLAAATG
jgi:hypothetical protein